jgi:FAD/FMN-containing dehydrogenase
VASRRPPQRLSTEHGIGIAKLAWLPLSRSEDEIALMRWLKRTLDQRGILKPGRVI